MRVAIVGAGLIGCMAGGALASAGAQVTLIGRRPDEEISARGLSIRLLDGTRSHISPSGPPGGGPGEIAHSLEASALVDAECILVCVKSQDTAAAANIIAAHARPGTTVISLQNGVDNVRVLAAACAGCIIVAGMVPFNVIRSDGGRNGNPEFIQTTGGRILTGGDGMAPRIVALLNQAGLDAAVSKHMEAVQWSKLTMNLNNAINALTGTPLKRQLLDARARRVLAACVSEALAVMKAKGITPVRIGKVDPRMIPFVLRLPTPLFRVVAASMLKIGEDARSSMWEDLVAGRGSEVDYLNATIVREADALGLDAPVNRAVSEAVHAAFNEGRSPMMSGADLSALLAGSRAPVSSNA